MDEEQEKTTEGEKTEVKPANTGEGNKPQTTPLIDIANAAAERMEKANEETARLVARQEELEQRRALGGRSEAGNAPKQKTDDEKWAEEAKERYAGTGLDPTDDKTPTTYA